MAKIKVSELEGPKLAEWVARAQGWVLGNPFGTMTDAWLNETGNIILYEEDYRPDINGTQAMELVQKFKPMLIPLPDGDWYAEIEPGENNGKLGFGDTPAEVICRAVVASVYGEYVEEEE